MRMFVLAQLPLNAFVATLAVLGRRIMVAFTNPVRSLSAGASNKMTAENVLSP
jgi:hypothetical protein